MTSLFNRLQSRLFRKKANISTLFWFLGLQYLCPLSGQQLNNPWPRYLIHVDRFQVKFEDQGHKSKFKVTGEITLINWAVQPRVRAFSWRKQCIRTKPIRTRMWANAQRNGRPAEYRWRPLFNAAKFGWRPVLECRAVTLPRRETRWNLRGAPNSPTDLSH